MELKWWIVLIFGVILAVLISGHVWDWDLRCMMFDRCIVWK